MLRYELIIVVFEAFIYISFLKFFIKKEINYKWLALAYAVFMAGMIGYRLYDDNTIIFFILSIGSIITFTMLFGVRFRMALLLGVSVSLANMLSKELSSFLMTLTYNITMFDICKDNDLYLTGSLVSKLILFTMTRIAIRVFIKHDRKLSLLQWCTTMAVPLVSIYSAHKIITIATQFRSTGGIYSFVFLGGFAIINMISFILYDGMAKRTNALLEQEQENARLEAENNRYNKMISYVDDVNSFIHDLQGHLGNILLLTETDKYDEATDYIRKLDIKIMDMYEHNILPQYPAVDTVLRQKIVEARVRGIPLECNITVPEGMPIEQIDLCIILGNALDNAIEACSKLDSDTKITLKMFLSRNRLSINITNPSTPVIIDGNKCETTKEDSSNHGYGMRNIENTINKYNGNMVVRYDEGYFCMIVLILF